jgi:hypothetical protein
MFQLLGTPGHRLRDSSFEIFPQSQELFCNEFWQVQIRFVPAVAAQQPGLVLGSHKSVRSSAEIPPPPAVIRADPTVYNGYVGKYRKTFLLGLIRIGPTLSIAHKADDLGSHLFASVRGMGTEEIFPTSKTCFVPGYNVSDDLRFTFVQNKKGTTKRVIVLWNGKKYSGNRISKEVS